MKLDHEAAEKSFFYTQEVMLAILGTYDPKPPTENRKIRSASPVRLKPPFGSLSALLEALLRGFAFATMLPFPNTGLSIPNNVQKLGVQNLTLPPMHLPSDN